MNIYVGNLNWHTTEAELQELFEPHGQITTVTIIKDKFTGESRGFGFIEMSSDEEGGAAIAALNGTELAGRTLKVNIARPKEERGGDRGQGRSDRGRDRW